MTIGYNELPNSLSERQRSLRAKLEAEKNPSRIGRPQSRDWSQAPLPELSRHIAILRNRKLKAKNVATIQDYEKEIRALTKVRTRRVKQARVNKQKRRREQTRRARERRQEQRKEESQQRSKDRIVQDFLNRDFYKYKSWHATEASEMEPLVTYRKTDENFWVRLDPKFLAVTGRQEGDVYRASRHTRDVMVYRNGTWQGISAREMGRIRPTIELPKESVQEPQPGVRIDEPRVEPPKPEPPKVEPPGPEAVPSSVDSLDRSIAFIDRLFANPDLMNRYLRYQSEREKTGWG